MFDVSDMSILCFRAVMFVFIFDLTLTCMIVYYIGSFALIILLFVMFIVSSKPMQAFLKNELLTYLLT